MNKQARGMILRNASILILASAAGCATTGRNTAAPQQTGPGMSPVISTQELRLVDADGNLQALLTLTEEGHPEFRLYDKKGNVRTALGLGGGMGPGLVLRDQENRARAVFFVADDGGPTISLLNEDSKVCGTLGLLAGGRAYLNLTGPAESARMTLFITEDGHPVGNAVDHNGEEIWSLQPEQAAGLDHSQDHTH